MQQNREPRIKPLVDNEPVFGKEVENIQWGKYNLFSKWCWKNWITTYRRMKLDAYLTTLN